MHVTKNGNRAEEKRQWYLKNRERVLQKQKECNLVHSETISEYQKKYRADNKETIAEIKKNHYQNNKTEINRKNKERDLARRKTDPAYKLRKNCSCTIWQALNGKKKGLSILKFLPYSMEDLRVHLEKQFDKNMNWANYGSYWHIDHIIPQSRLPYTSMYDENFQKCWALSNLRPLEAIENIKKSNK